jgi:hypothetical protein
MSPLIGSPAWGALERPAKAVAPVIRAIGPQLIPTGSRAVRRASTLSMKSSLEACSGISTDSIGGSEAAAGRYSSTTKGPGHHLKALRAGA